MNDLENNILLVFIKYPRPGFVKTRLAKDIGTEKAALLYKKLAEATVKRTASGHYKSLIFYAGAQDEGLMTEWLGNEAAFYRQEGKDLGERMSNAFKMAFRSGGEKIVAIGSDSPFVNADVIKDAFTRLKTVECVIGPSSDGGYYLLGLNNHNDPLFQEIDWSTDKVLGQTKKTLKDSRTSYTELKELFDIDTVSDLDRLKGCLENIDRSNVSFYEEITDLIGAA